MWSGMAALNTPCSHSIASLLSMYCCIIAVMEFNAASSSSLLVSAALYNSTPSSATSTVAATFLLHPFPFPLLHRPPLLKSSVHPLLLMPSNHYNGLDG